MQNEEWEYKVVSHAALDKEQTENAFCSHGDCGWELVAVSGGYGYFKRKRMADEKR